MISIAFGAPNIYGNKRAQEINDNAHLKVHLFNVTHESDPVASLQDEFEGHEVKGDTAVRPGRFPIGIMVPLRSGKIKSWSRKKFSKYYKSAVIAAYNSSAMPSDDSPKMKVESPPPEVTWPSPSACLLEPGFIC